MNTAKLFQNGHSQAVRLPKEFQFQGKEVEIFRRGKDVVLREKQKNSKQAFELLTTLPDDFFSSERIDLPAQDRDFFE